MVGIDEADRGDVYCVGKKAARKEGLESCPLFPPPAAD
jgi:hypothetical protein